ncbi:xanthine dehydrogenase family protein subunit M [Pelagicoccus sp. SDUM812002]|uniref:FAD binding domain-containing protein n=1 Tax=Pelagicoccus sp. SDUM812002 TaxID=3041266 RepID=UPI00280DCA8B|nr:xanthine dehydrogenase family protein subunit M [Pelagicoccus sp. SDUM812002]MDQ8186545.1 xanthine dehydrogenase family protein subunit M [Pelagicoccus sp. SDUM812002]
MRPFKYNRPLDLATASNAGTSGSFIAGGTNLLDLMKCDVEQPSQLVDLNHLGLGSISETADGGLELGALATNTTTAYHPIVQERYPILSRAILAGASPQLRNKATNGGNLLQRTRCPYFFDTDSPCNKRVPGSGCPAKEGYSKLHAILGASDSCIATHPSDMCVALRALDATIRVSGPHGERRIEFADFHRLPGDQPEIETSLEKGEVITAILLPADGFADNFAYFKVRERASYAFALVSVAAVARLEGNQLKEGRVALGGVAAKPWRDLEAESLLCDQPCNAETFGNFADALLQSAKTYPGNRFKVPMARAAIVRALSEATHLNQL